MSLVSASDFARPFQRTLGLTEDRWAGRGKSLMSWQN